MSKNKELLKNDDIAQAILIADDFNNEFLPLTENTPFVLLPLVNKPIIDYTLEFLALGGIEETFVFCSSHIDVVKDHVCNAKKSAIWANVMEVHVMVSESCSSLGDCLRDIDAKGVIRGNFILVEPGVISNMKLLPILQQHIETLKNDKGATMTLVMQETGIEQNGRCPTEETLVVTNDSNQVLLHRRLANHDQNKIKFPLDMFLDHVNVNIRYNIRDTHISICGPSVLPLFADNFDYQTRWDFIRSIMMVDEIDDNTIYCHILKDGQMGAAITSWNMFQTLSWDVIAGWFYPISYKIKAPITFGNSIVKGENCKISASATLINCVLGDSVSIGNKVTLKETIVFSNCKIEDSCEISHCILGNSCIVKAKSKLTNGTILSDKVVLNRNTNLNNATVQSSKPEDADFDVLGPQAYKVITETDDFPEHKIRNRFCIHKATQVSYEEGFETSDTEDESYTTYPVPDDTKMFFTEVTDSLARGIEDKLQCHNLILEINSSRYAYNVSLKEVNYFVSKAILSLPFQLQDGVQYLPALSHCLAYFSPILKNYIRDDESMTDCLQAIQDVAIASNELSSCITKVLHWLYNKDFLSEEVIVLWFKNLDSSTPIYSKVIPFVKWLQEAEEEDDDDEDD